MACQLNMEKQWILAIHCTNLHVKSLILLNNNNSYNMGALIVTGMQKTYMNNIIITMLTK